MFKTYKSLFLSILFCFFFVFGSAQMTEEELIVESIPFPSFVSDNTDVFTTDEELDLLKEIEEIRKTTTLEFAVCTVETIGQQSLHQVATTALEMWEIGKQRRNGVLFLLVTGERRVYIATGEGLRKYLKDDQVRLTLEMQVVPKLRDGNYFQGVQAGMNAIVNDLDGTPIAKRSSFFTLSRIFKAMPLLIVLLTILLVLFTLYKVSRKPN